MEMIFINSSSSPLRMSKNHSQPKREVRLGQVGWLGQTGAIYPLNAVHAEIARYEQGGYSPIYIELDD